jgi:hypothetical protein
LLDERVRLRAQAGAHEQFLNVAQAAEFAVQQIFAVAGAKQAAGDDDFSGAELLLVELAAADFQHNVRSHRSGGGRGQRRSDVVYGQRHLRCEARFVVGEGYGDDVYFRTRDFDFFGLAGLRVFYGLFGSLGGAGADGGFVPVVGDVCFGLGILRKIVLDVDFGRRHWRRSRCGFQGRSG